MPIFAEAVCFLPEKSWLLKSEKPGYRFVDRDARLQYLPGVLQRIRALPFRRVPLRDEKALFSLACRFRQIQIVRVAL